MARSSPGWTIDADFLDAGLNQFQEMIVNQRASDTIGADDGEEFLFDGVRRGKMASAQARGGDDSFDDRLRHDGWFELRGRARRASHWRRRDSGARRTQWLPATCLRKCPA